MNNIMREYYSPIHLATFAVIFVMLPSLATAIHTTQLTSIVAQSNITDLACEGSSMNVMCATGQGINVRSAFWGRDDTVTCATEAVDAKKTPIPCTPYCSSNPTETVKNMCNKKQLCRLFATEDFFQLPKCCPNVMKYLKVSHHCNLMSGN